MPDDVGGSANPRRPLVQMTYEQLRFIQLWAAEHGAAGVSIEEKGPGHLDLVAWDKTNVDIAHRAVPPLDLSLPD